MSDICMRNHGHRAAPQKISPESPIVGPTCAGKTSLIDYLLQAHENWRAVCVGREMRRRYPPEFFQGQAALEATEPEVWELFAAHWRSAVAAEAPVFLVDGQPRHPSHPGRLHAYCPQWAALVLSCPTLELIARSKLRDHTPGQQLLTQSRISQDVDVQNDLIDHHGVPVAATIHSNRDGWRDLARLVVYGLVKAHRVPSSA
jgi:hypothetical protein